MRRIHRLRRGQLTTDQWRRLLANAFGFAVVDHFAVTIQHPHVQQVWERTVSCCDGRIGSEFRRQHGFPTEADWMKFAMLKIEDGQVLGRRPDGTPFWGKDGADLTRQNEEKEDAKRLAAPTALTPPAGSPAAPTPAAVSAPSADR